MRPSDVFSTLIELIPTREPTMLWGPPGVGKSDLVRQAAGKLGREIIDIRSVLLDPVDVGGLPSIVGDETKWSRPFFIPRSGEGVLFLDELPQAPPLVQGALLQLLLDRKVREHTLGDGWSIVAAGNRAEDRAGANRLISPMLNRLIHVDCEVSNEDWQEWAITAGIAPEVRAFLKYRSNLLWVFEPQLNQRAFPTPRSWSKLSNVLAHVHADRLMAIASGTVGEGPAAEFVGYLQYWQQMPDLDICINNPEKAPVPREAAVLWGVATALVDKVKAATKEVLNKAIKYIQRLPAEFSILAMRELCMVNKQIYQLPEAVAWLGKNREYLGVK